MVTDGKPGGNLTRAGCNSWNIMKIKKEKQKKQASTTRRLTTAYAEGIHGNRPINTLGTAIGQWQSTSLH